MQQEEQTRDNSILSELYLREQIAPFLPSLSLRVVQTTGSTNSDLKLVADHFSEDCLLIAGMQTAGRGRSGRSFFSPEQTGLYMSFLLHPGTDLETSTHLTTLAAAATAEAIEEIFNCNIGIKWVNDLYLDGRKIAGILTECSPFFSNGCPSYCIVGIGVNIAPPKQGFPEELASVAGAICSSEEMHLLCREKLAISITQHFFHYYQKFPARNYFPSYLERSIVIGKKVTLLPTACDNPHLYDTTNLEQVTVIGINHDCHLMVRRLDGSQATLSDGEVRINLNGKGSYAPENI